MFNRDLDDIKKNILSCDKENYCLLKDTADNLLENKIRFVSNWAMERCEDLVEFNDFNWEKVYNNDPEWTFMLNRQEYLMDLLITYIVERNSQYLDKLKEFIFRRIDNMTLISKKNNSTRTLDTGIRIGIWTRILKYKFIPGFLSEQEENKIKQSILEQINFLYENFEDGYYISNWGLIQAAAVIEFSLLYENEVEKSVELFFKQVLEKNVELSILEDGAHWEQSIMYHVEVFISLLNLVRVSDTIFLEFKDKMYKMVEYIIAVTSPDHHQFAIGDSDYTDTRDIITAATILFREPLWKPYCYEKVNIDSILMFSKDEIKEYENLESSNINLNKSKHFKSIGQVSIKDNGTAIYFKNGSMANAHCHSDLNSICLYYQNKPIFIDAGRGTYTESEERYYLKSSFAHSSVIVDNESPEIINASWKYGRYPKSMFLDYTYNEKFDYIESGILGEVKKGKYNFIRRFLKIENCAFIILDEVIMQGNHEASVGFILDPSIEYQAGKLGDLNLLDYHNFEIKDTIISRKYNQIENGNKIIKKVSFTDHLITPTILYKNGVKIKNIDIFQIDNKLADGAYGWQIEVNKKKFFVALLTQYTTTGISVFKMGEYFFRGKCVIIDQDKEKIYRLKN